MNFSEYQQAAKETAIYPKESAIQYLGLGLASEAGELCGKLKKIIRDQGGVIKAEDREALAYELGDIQWYISQLATELGVGLDMVATINIAKLQDRQQRNVLGGSGDKR